MHRTLARSLQAAVVATALFALAGCGPTYVNPNIVDQSQAKQRLQIDSAICQREANNDVPPTYGLERFEFDPTIEAQATRWVANVAEDDENLDAFSTCMYNRGWRLKKKK
ncbi:MAG: hypothetical protein ACP59X_22450 [Solidesulfovibrio sp. DCME]|uniref:hypothetical protein n=1 Tax=Solidesulfovibrio sp. DCME TaxID=3447380 RepID=UPI003D0D6197